MPAYCTLDLHFPENTLSQTFQGNNYQNHPIICSAHPGWFYCTSILQHLSRLFHKAGYNQGLGFKSERWGSLSSSFIYGSADEVLAQKHDDRGWYVAGLHLLNCCFHTVFYSLRSVIWFYCFSIFYSYAQKQIQFLKWINSDVIPPQSSTSSSCSSAWKPRLKCKVELQKNKRTSPQRQFQ